MAKIVAPESAAVAALSAASPAERLVAVSPPERNRLLRERGEDECARLLDEWQFWARPKQLAPAGDWFCWLIMAGRGFGKTRLGSEWVRGRVEGTTPLTAPPGAPRRIALLSKTFSDVREVMLEGDSGLISISPSGLRPELEISRRRLVWPNGAMAYIYSGDEPDQLRGPQHHIAWCDEIAKWKDAETCWMNLVMGLRLGERPQALVTTTPRPFRFLRDLADRGDTVVTQGSTRENAANLSARFLEDVERMYQGTSIGRQELDGQLLEERSGALWSMAMIDNNRISTTPPMRRIVVAVDPPVTTGDGASECGIIVAGLGDNGHCYVLADVSCQGLTPARWMAWAIKAFEKFAADRLVAEVNQGGDLVETLLRQQAPRLPYRAVRATRGKITRAEPVAALYEQGKVHHVGVFAELEDQLWGYTGAPGELSPDRLDALVWAVSDLMLHAAPEPRIRTI